MISPLLKHVTQSHLKEATPFLLGKHLQPLYLQFEPQVSGTVFLLAQVHPDGFGDYLALLKAARALQQRHPKLSFELVYTYARPLPEVDTTGLTLHPFFELPGQPILEPILEGKPGDGTSAESILAEALYERMKSSLALVHIALALNTFDNPLLAPKSLYFAEAGNFQGYQDSLKFNWYSLGLGPLEEGIFLDDPHPSLEDRSRYLGYIRKNPKQAETFAHLVRLLEPNKTPEIINPATPLPYETFQYYLHHSGPLVGCTGDTSLAECLALGKIPYYEFRRHKAETLTAFIRLALFLNLPDIKDYFTTLSDIENDTAEPLFAILHRPTFAPAWQTLLNYIHTWCRLEESLTARLRRLLFGTQALEADLAAKIVDGRISFDEAFQQVKEYLKDYQSREIGHGKK